MVDSEVIDKEISKYCTYFKNLLVVSILFMIA